MCTAVSGGSRRLGKHASMNEHNDDVVYTYQVPLKHLMCFHLLCFSRNVQTKSTSAALLDDDDGWNDFTLLSKSVMYSFVSCMWENEIYVYSLRNTVCSYLNYYDKMMVMLTRLNGLVCIVVAVGSRLLVRVIILYMILLINIRFSGQLSNNSSFVEYFWASIE